MKRSGTKQNAGRLIQTKGFTLIELLTVIVIMGLLMGMIIGVATFANRKNLEAKAQADIETIRTALTDYQMDVGLYPVSGHDDGAWTNELEVYIRDGFLFTDPWGQDYIYIADDTPADGIGAERYRLYSKGLDGEDGTEEADADNIEAGGF